MPRSRGLPPRDMQAEPSMCTVITCSPAFRPWAFITNTSEGGSSLRANILFPFSYCGNYDHFTQNLKEHRTHLIPNQRNDIELSFVDGEQGLKKRAYEELRGDRDLYVQSSSGGAPRYGRKNRHALREVTETLKLFMSTFVIRSSFFSARDFEGR